MNDSFVSGVMDQNSSGNEYIGREVTKKCADPLKEIVEEIVLSAEADEDSGDFVPSCCLFLFFDCVFLHIWNAIKGFKFSRNVVSSTPYKSI